MKKRRPITLTRRLTWALQYIAFLGVMLVIRLVPLTAVFTFGKALGTLAHARTRRYRQIVQRNLRIALYKDKVPLEEIDQITRRVFQLTGANLFSALKTATLPPKKLQNIITVNNLDLIKEAAAKGNGIVLLLAHMGNWELLAQLSFLLPKGTRGGTHYRPLNNPYINRAIESQRRRIGTKLFAKRSSTHEITSFLKDGGLLGILSDQRAGRKAELCDFFGRLTGCTPMPSLLARRAKSEVLALSVTTDSTAHWTLTAHPCEAPFTTQNLMKSLEASLASSIADGFWFQDRWKLGQQPKLFIPATAKHVPDTLTPCRILVLKKTTSDEVPLPENLRPDILIETAIVEPDLTAQLVSIDRNHRAPLEVVCHSFRSDELDSATKSLGIPKLYCPPPSAGNA